MAYNSLIARTDAQSLVPEEVSYELMGKATEQSAVLQLFRHIPVGRNQHRFPVLSALPVAYWVSGDTGLKQTTQLAWENRFLNIEEIATIMPVPDNVLADVEENIWDSAMPLLTEALGRTLDQAVFFGTNAPASFPTSIQSAAASASNTVTVGSAASAGGFFNDVDAMYAKVEADGYDVSGWVANVAAKSKLRTARDSQGRKLDVGRVDGTVNSLDGMDIVYPMRGLWSAASGQPLMFGGEFNEQFVVGIRSDITMKILTEAVIQDNTGQIIYNLAQQDMTAIRLTFRLGWQVANTITNDQPVAANRYPAVALLNA